MSLVALACSPATIVVLLHQTSSLASALRSSVAHGDSHPRLLHARELYELVKDGLPHVLWSDREARKVVPSQTIVTPTVAG